MFLFQMKFIAIAEFRSNQVKIVRAYLYFNVLQLINTLVLKVETIVPCM